MSKFKALFKYLLKFELKLKYLLTLSDTCMLTWGVLILVEEVKSYAT